VAKTAVFLEEAWGFGEVRVTLEPGKIYFARATEPLPTGVYTAIAEGWIEDERGTPVSEKVTVTLHAYRGGGYVPGVTLPVTGTRK
jgi:hypothetical protein